MKRYYLLILLFLSAFVSAQETKKVCLQKGSNISIVILSQIDSQKFKGTPEAKVAADVWDADGEIVLIKKGTPVTLQVNCRKASLSGDVGRIEIQPISTSAFNGREITFDYSNPIVFVGNENGVFASRQNARVASGTAFIATLGNTYCFKVDE
ncbi:MAG: hypothetical protein ACI30A_02885 [Paludibacteraceae bacterium]